MIKRFRVVLALVLGLSIGGIAEDYFFLFEKPAPHYVVEQNPIKHPNRSFRVVGLEEVELVETNTLMKDEWVLQAETAYTNTLIAAGYHGAWTNTSMTFQMVGLDLLNKMNDPNVFGVALPASLHKGALESLYTQLYAYAAEFGITDLRTQWPWGSLSMGTIIETNRYVTFRGVIYKRED